MAKRKNLGFRTPSMEIQEEYKKLLEQIMDRKANWEEVLITCNRLYNYSMDGADKVIKEVESRKEYTHEELMEIEHRVLSADTSMTLLLAARIGKELAECDVRISHVEKEIKDLRRGIDK